MISDKFTKHFMVLHSFVSDEARQLYLTPPEIREPAEERATEHEWAEASKGEYAQCLQTWVGNNEFFYCHWIANSDDDVIKQLYEFELEGTVVTSMVNEMHQFMSAYRNSHEILQQYPENGDQWL